MKKIIYSIFIFTFLSNIVFAQTKQLTIEDAVIGQYRDFYPEYINQICWKPNTSSYLFVEDWTVIKEVGVKNTEEKEVLNITDFSKILTTAGLSEATYFYGLTWIDENSFWLQHENNIIIYNVLTKNLDLNIPIDENALNVQFFEKNNSVAYTIDNNIFYSSKNTAKKQVTWELEEGIVCGSDYVHRQEFGIDKGIFWSPKGNYLAFYRKDETMVADYPIVDVTTRIATENPEKYPMAGEKSEEVTLGIYNISTDKTVYLKTGEPKEQYLTCVTWDPSEEFVYVAVLNREQNHMKLNKYSALTGELVKTLFEEENEKYVEPEHQLIFSVKEPTKFFWYSERDNYQHLYQYTTDGQLLKQVTKGDWLVQDFLGFDADEKNIFIMATIDSPIEKNAYKVNLKTGDIIRLTAASGIHNVQISTDGKYFIDEYSNTETPQITNLTSTDGKIVRNLLTAENPMTDFNLGKMTISTIKAADGVTDLYYRLITPPDFDKNKKYPSIIYVYGGPHAQMVTNEWLGGAQLWEFYMAQKGYVVFVLDNRGSENRGLLFENVIHRQCGVNEMEDQIKGVEFLKTLGYVDADRIGVHGWSYGGFMASSLITTYPDIFKVAVAGGPVIDWKYYEVMYGERYMDTPLENPEGYEKTSLLNKSANLKGKLLIIHGCVDPVVVWQNSLMFVEKCIENKVLLDYFVYPTSEHNVRGYDRIHLMRKVTQYFDDFL